MGKIALVALPFPICATTDDIRHILEPSNDEVQEYPKPFWGIAESILYYDEVFAKAPTDAEDCKNFDNSWFYVKVYFGETTYKEIRQLQDISAAALFGIIPRYIGFSLVIVF